MRDNFNKILIIVLGLVLIGGAVYLFLGQTTTQTDPNNDTANEAVEPNWTVFISDQVGISFSYPDHFGEVNITIEEGQAGQKFVGSFSDFEGLEFGGSTANFTEGRETLFTDVQGFKEQDGQFFALFPLEQEYPVGTAQEIEAGSLGGIIFRGQNFEQNEVGIPPDPLHFGSENLAAIFNLPNQTFPGIGFLNTDPEQLNPEIFIRMLSSLRSG